MVENDGESDGSSVFGFAGLVAPSCASSELSTGEVVGPQVGLNVGMELGRGSVGEIVGFVSWLRVGLSVGENDGESVGSSSSASFVVVVGPGDDSRSEEVFVSGMYTGLSVGDRVLIL